MCGKLHVAVTNSVGSISYICDQFGAAAMVNGKDVKTPEQKRTYRQIFDHAKDHPEQTTFYWGRPCPEPTQHDIDTVMGHLDRALD